MHSPFESLSTVAVSAFAVVLMGAANVPDLPASSAAATIFNPGAGDYAGFRIVVEPDGSASAVDAAGNTSVRLRSDVVQPLFDDLKSAGDPSTSARPCAAPADGMATTVAVNAAVDVSWGGRRWTSLACSSEPHAVRLLDDAMTIRRALYVQVYRSRMIVVYVGARGANEYGTGAAYGGAAYGAPSGVYFTTGGFNFDHFAAGAFQSGQFSAGPRATTSPWTGSLSGTSPYSTLPYSSITTGLPAGSLTYTSPYSSLSTGSMTFSSPYSNGPYSSSPLSSSP